MLRRLVERLRAAVEPDMLILANYGWNFNVRNPNPGGNHGSFFRISTHSVFMLAGAGVPTGLRVEQPYDSLNFAPTLLALLRRPVARYPAPPVGEVVVAINAACPCSAHAQNALSVGSGDTSFSVRTSTNSAASLRRLMIPPTRFRRTPSLERTSLYSERMSSVTSQVKVPSSSQCRRSEALGFSTARRDLNPATRRRVPMYRWRL